MIHKQPNADWNDDTLVLEYFHHSEPQRQWTWKLIGRYPLKGTENVLDFGCGDGKITAQLSHCLPNGQITGMDLSEQMISFAKRSFPRKYYPSLSFVRTNNNDFEEVDPLEKFDRIYSFFTFHLLGHPETVLKNLRKQIKEQGELILVFPQRRNQPFFEAAIQTFNDYHLQDPWTKSKKQKNAPTMRTADGVKSIIESAGWKITHQETANTPYVFVTREQLIHWLIGTTLTTNWNVPKKIAPEFFNHLIDHMVKIDPNIIDEQNAYHFQLERIHVIARIQS